MFQLFYYCIAKKQNLILMHLTALLSCHHALFIIFALVLLGK